MLYYLQGTGSVWMTANTFGVYLPRNTEEMRETGSKFALKFGILHAFGCIDGAHAPLKRH